MNRADRRASKREVRKEVKKAAEMIDKLTPNQVKLIDQVSTEKAYKKAEAILIIYQRVVSASLIENGFSIKQIEKIFNVANELMQEEDQKSIKLSEELKRSGNIDMVKKKIEEGVLREINTLMDAGKGRKEVIEAVLFKFPTMSKAMIINTYQEVKESRKQEDPDVKEALEYVFDEEEEKEMKKKEVEKVLVEADKVAEDAKKEVKAVEVTPVVVTEATIEQDELNSQARKAAEQSKLQVLSITLRGQNGTYRACENGVELSDLGSIILFENAGQVDEFANEIKEVFERIKA